jgi:hypothetical protein
VNQYLILALADDGLIFDRAHADCMQLPFDRGWAAWHVYRRKSERDLSFIDTFPTYAEALAFIETQLILTAKPPTAGVYVSLI